MAVPDPSAWLAVGRTINARYYTIEAGVLGCIAEPEVPDTAATAVENVAFHKRYFAEHGPGVMLIFTDEARSQDHSARRVYQEELSTDFMLGVAMIGGTLLTRAFASFYMGLSRPRVPFKMFPGLPDALAWARRLLAGQASRHG